MTFEDNSSCDLREQYMRYHVLGRKLGFHHCSRKNNRLTENNRSCDRDTLPRCRSNSGQDQLYRLGQCEGHHSSGVSNMMDNF